LPPYSPDLNPIEMAFAKLKTLLRAKAVRTLDALWQEIGTSATFSSLRNAKTTSPPPDTDSAEHSPL
jgi:transposase